MSNSRGIVQFNVDMVTNPETDELVALPASVAALLSYIDDASSSSEQHAPITSTRYP